MVQTVGHDSGNLRFGVNRRLTADSNEIVRINRLGSHRRLGALSRIGDEFDRRDRAWQVVSPVNWRFTKPENRVSTFIAGQPRHVSFGVASGQ